MSKHNMIPKIDTNLKLVSHEIEEIRSKLAAYLSQKEEETYVDLMFLQAKLLRVIEQRNKEHTEKSS